MAHPFLKAALIAAFALALIALRYFSFGIYQAAGWQGCAAFVLVCLAAAVRLEGYR